MFAKIHKIVHGKLHATKKCVMKHVPHKMCYDEMSSATHAMGCTVGQHSTHKVPAQAAYIRAAESKLLQECRGASCMLGYDTRMHAVKCNTHGCGMILAQL